MKLDFFVQNTSNIFAENRLLKFCMVVVSAAVVFAVYDNRLARKEARVILVPPTITTRMMIQGDKASDEYIKEFARYVTNLALTYNPATARIQFSELLSIYDPSTFAETRKALYDLADKIESTKAASVFYLNKIVHDVGAHKIEVSGTKKTYLADTKTEEVQKVYEVLYKFDNGKFIILRLGGVGDRVDAQKE